MRKTLALLAALAALVLIFRFARDSGESGDGARADTSLATPAADASAARSSDRPDLRATEALPNATSPPADEVAAATSAAETLDAPRTAVDTAPGSGREAVTGAPLVELRFVDADDAPVARVAWIVFRDGTTLASGTGDDAGRAELPSRVLAAQDGDAPLELAMRADGFAPVRVRFDELEAGEHGAPDAWTARLGVGDAIAGRVLLDGVPPPAGFELVLRGTAPFLATDGLPREAAGPILANETVPAQMRLLVDTDGAFAFRGLPADWAGALRFDETLLLKAFTPADRGEQRVRGRGVELAAPLANALLELVTAPFLVGRAVDPITGDAASAAWVSCSWKVGKGGNGASTGVDPDGAFRFAFPDGMPEQVVLEVAPGRSSQGERYAIEIPPGTTSWDVGALATPLARTVAVEVVDPGGAPIANAFVEPAGGGDGLTTRRERLVNGSGTIEVAPETRELRASAVGFAAAEAPLPPPDSGEPLVLRLEPGPVVVVTLPADCAGVQVAITGDEPPFEGSQGPTWVPELWGAGGRAMSGKDVKLNGASDGRYEIVSLLPGVGFRVAAIDAFDVELDARDVPPLDPGERLEIALDFELVRRSVAGKVVGPDGAPVAGARVSLSRSVDGGAWDPRLGPRGANAVTDEHGAFAFEGVTVDRADVLAAAVGFAPLTLADLELGDAPLVLALAKGREVALAVVDAEGEPVLGAYLERVAGAASYAIGATSGDDGIRIPNAPDAEFDALVGVCGRRIVVRVPAHVDAFTLELGRVIACTIALPGLAAAWPAERISVELADESGDPPVYLGAQVPQGAEEVVFPALFPGVYTVRASGGLPSAKLEVAGPVEIQLDTDGQRVVLSLQDR